MTLGELLEDLEFLTKRYSLDTPVKLGEYDRAGDPNYFDPEAAEYSPSNDVVVIW